ncbi:hypothetical protein HYV10_00340 [Candidatus Dependentiae bacterium]|nr:hypothetical protein [Candidatus Dependentiae bacterium]
MRQLLWAVNSSLLLLFLVAQLVFFILYTPIPRRVTLEPDKISVQDKNLGLVISIKKIYETNDLFGTYVAPVVIQPKAIEDVIPKMPEAPALIQFKIQVESEKVFIAPLAVVLKGVMYNYTNPEKSIAIIQFQDSKEEINYHIGQFISDAQILKIYPNRIIIIRSNGQQETLYLKEAEAAKDMKFEILQNVSDMTIPFDNNKYYIPLEKFKLNIKTLAQFIDILDLTTVYQKGQSIGCRVGKSGKDTLASKLGLLKDDIIQQINGIPVTDMTSRVLIYDHIIQKKIGDEIAVKLDRSGKEMILHYVLSDSNMSNRFVSAKNQPKATLANPLTSQQVFDIEQQRKKMLEQRIKFAPSVQQIQADERNKILQARNKELFAKQDITQQPKMPDAYSITPNEQAFSMISGAQG